MQFLRKIKTDIIAKPLYAIKKDIQQGINTINYSCHTNNQQYNTLS
jgi:hypothetical protein